MRFLLLTLAAMAAFAQDSKIWNGVFTAAQADRGKAAFEHDCVNCHIKDLNGSTRGPALKGDRFMLNWQDTTVDSLFTKIRFSMPATYPETVPDDVKLDIVAYLLQSNGFPVGTAELKQDEDALESIQIAKRGSAEIPNFTLVEVVGCLEPGPKNAWTLTKASAPVATREETATPALLKEAQAKPLGGQTFVLVSASAFSPTSQQGHKIEARG